MRNDRFAIAPARTDDDLAAIRRLFRAYEASLDVDLSYQDFASEFANLPGKYAPPDGDILLACDREREPIGCVALRPLSRPGCCEMKRLYVVPEARGTGLGKTLMEALITIARRAGYREMWLDTLPTMNAAQSLYRSAGFEPAEAYYDTPVAGTVFMRLMLGN